MITREAFTDAMKLAVLTKGEDYTYPFDPFSIGSGCDYRRGGEPSCLIGHALDILGVKTTAADEEKEAKTVLKRYGVTDPVVLEAADVAQGAQDLGVPWGTALVLYLEAVSDDALDEQKRFTVSKGFVLRLSERIALMKNAS